MVHIILLDGCNLTVSKGIEVPSGNNGLTIYSQSMGILTAFGENGNAGIGVNANQASGVIAINGGYITAHGSDATKGGGVNGGGTSGGGSGNGGAGIVTINRTNRNVTITDNANSAKIVATYK